MYHANVKVSLMIENVTWIKTGITVNVGVTVKIEKNICAKKVNFGILQNLAAKMVNLQDVLVIQ